MPKPIELVASSQTDEHGDMDSTQDTTQSHPFARETLFRQAGPLLGAALLVLLSIAISQSTPGEGRMLIQAATLTALTVSAMALLPWGDLPAAFQAGPALSFLMVTFLIRQATGGPESIYAQLVLVPILWLAVFGSAIELGAGIVALSVVLLGPIIATPGAESQWPQALLLIGTSTLVGAGVQRLFTQLRTHSSALVVLTRTDPLTGVGNRRAWDEELEPALQRAEGERSPICIALVDVDHFKEFNDGRGHQAGDRLLKEITAGWRSQLRDGDTLARLGGDEFAIILPKCPLDAAQRIVGRLCAEVPAGQTCSTGLAMWDWIESTGEFIARADAALYEAKEGGRNRIVVA